ncbi:MAG: sigma 54-dependent Fis family transcriptional regulator [Candidatus Riflebacteria bacterium]|nr:sigma 54-dependent Fis family transcriptional regulator [Candidatus Riflebacteria bacterium]
MTDDSDEDSPPTARMEGAPVRVRLRRGVLLVLDGADAGRQVSVESERITIGSDPSADLRLCDRTVSKRHVEIEALNGQFLLRDLGSTTGTFLNGTRVKEAYLAPGDLLVLGACSLRFEPRMEEVRILPSSSDRFGLLYGTGTPMRQVFGVLERVAPTDSTVLVCGETGTGKDLIARSIHAASPRKQKPLMVFDCSAVSPELMGSELFGHVEGAFTGASRSRKGAFEAAHGGTVFLDEIGELPIDLQPKLLRVLEAREVRPLGANSPVSVDVRVVAATHRDLDALVRAGRFRQDLFYRLAVVRIDLPPLRERREDLKGLARALLEGLSPGRPAPELTDDAVAALAVQAWPGNVRELRNVLERTIALAPGPRLAARDLMLVSSGSPSDQAPDLSGLTLDQIEREVIRQALERSGGNQKEAARQLGIHRNTFREKMKRAGLKGSSEPRD